MYVCLCYGISEKKLRDLCSKKVSGVKDIQRVCEAGKNCGACICQVKSIVKEEKTKRKD